MLKPPVLSHANETTVSESRCSRSSPSVVLRRTLAKSNLLQVRGAMPARLDSEDEPGVDSSAPEWVLSAVAGAPPDEAATPWTLGGVEVKEGLAMPQSVKLLGAKRAAVAVAVVHVVGVVAAAGVVVAAADVGVVAAVAGFGVVSAAAAAAADDDIVVAGAGAGAASVRAHAHQAPCQADIDVDIDVDIDFAVVGALEGKLSQTRRNPAVLAHPQGRV